LLLFILGQFFTSFFSLFEIFYKNLPPNTILMIDNQQLLSKNIFEKNEV